VQKRSVEIGRLGPFHRVAAAIASARTADPDPLGERDTRGDDDRGERQTADEPCAQDRPHAASMENDTMPIKPSLAGRPHGSRRQALQFGRVERRRKPAREETFGLSNGRLKVLRPA
jgi:hypothetical protein